MIHPVQVSLAVSHPQGYCDLRDWFHADLLGDNLCYDGVTYLCMGGFIAW